MPKDAFLLYETTRYFANAAPTNPEKKRLKTQNLAERTRQNSTWRGTRENENRKQKLGKLCGL